jgi:hypothetical protein
MKIFFFEIIALMLFAVSCKDAPKETNSAQGPKDPACASKSSTDCNSSPDCQLQGSNCVASSSFCAKFTTQTDCSTNGGSSCTWSSTSQSCVVYGSSGGYSPGGYGPSGYDSSSNCSQFTTQSECISGQSSSQYGQSQYNSPSPSITPSSSSRCSWNASLNQCYDPSNSNTSYGASCSSYYTQTQCSQATGCYWQNNMCISSSSGNNTSDPYNCRQYTLQQQCPSNYCYWNGSYCGPNSNGSNGSYVNCAQYTMQQQCQQQSMYCTWNGYSCLNSSNGQYNPNVNYQLCASKSLMLCMFDKNCKWSFPSGPCLPKQ